MFDKREKYLAPLFILVISDFTLEVLVLK